MSATVRTILFWVLMVALAIVLWKMASVGPKSPHQPQSADAIMVVSGLVIILAIVLWKMASVRPRTAPGAQAADAGTVIVISAPAGADIYADGKFVGDASASLTLAAGKHAIRLSLKGYKDWTRDLSVLASSKVSLNASLEKN